MELPPFRRRKLFKYVRANRWVDPPRIVNMGPLRELFFDTGQEIPGAKGYAENESVCG